MNKASTVHTIFIVIETKLCNDAGLLPFGIVKTEKKKQIKSIDGSKIVTDKT